MVGLLRDDRYDFKERQEQYKLNSNLYAMDVDLIDRRKTFFACEPAVNSAVLQHNVTHIVTYSFLRLLAVLKTY